MKLRCLCLVGSLALVCAHAALAQQGVPRKPCVAPDAPRGCSALPSGPSSMVPNEFAPERRQALARLPLNEPPPRPEPEASVSVRPASPEAEAATVAEPADERPR